MYRMADSCTLALYVASWRQDRQVCWEKYPSCTSKIYVVPLYTVCTCIYNVCTCIYNVCALYNQLSEQIFVADTEMQMQDWGISLDPPMHWTIWMRAVQKMVNFFVSGHWQMLQKQRRPSTVVVYAYNMWYPCTVYVHVYTPYVHVCSCMCNVCAWFNQLS